MITFVGNICFRLADADRRAFERIPKQAKRPGKPSSTACIRLLCVAFV
jgi:hypothetical protein